MAFLKSRFLNVTERFLPIALMICFLIYMLVRGLAVAGVSGRALQKTGFGGHLVIFLGVVFLVVAYYSLSPFSKVRRFFEGGLKRRKKDGS